MGILNERQKLSLQISRPWLYLITNRRALSSSLIQLQIISEAAQAGCQLIQIREKDLDAQGLYEFTSVVIAMARPFGAKILVNDRVDVALAAGADGVHLRTDSLEADQVRAIVPSEFLIGVSTHTPIDAHAAKMNGADFIVYGPVFETASKAQYGTPLGLQNFKQICTEVDLPVLGLGGISAENFSDVLSHGAAGIAGIGLFQNRDALASNIKMMLSSEIQPQDSV
jgi:thiamine-phosphate pyrophosphorylase